MKCVEPFFDLLKLVGGIGQVVLFVPQLFGDILRGVHEVVQLSAEKPHFIRHAANPFQRMRGVRDHGRSAVRCFIAVERADGGFHRVRQLFGILEHLPALKQLVLFAGLQLGAFDLVDLEFQRLDQTQLFRFVHGQPPDLLLHGADLVIRLPVVFQQRFVMGKQIEIADMRRLVEQLLRIVLAVDLDELDAELPERRDRDRLAADAAAVFPVCKDLTGNTKLRLIRDLIFREPRQLRHAGKNGADKRLLRAGTDHLARGPFTQNGRDRVYDDGFARAGLTGKDIKASVKGDLCLLDHGNIFNMQGRKHGSSSCSVRRSMLDLFPDLRAKLGGGLRILQHNKARVVACKRPEHLRDIQLINRSGGAVGKAGHGLDDDHVLRVFNARDALPEDQVQLCREGMLCRLGGGRVPVNAVWSKLLDNAQLLDIAGNGSLRGTEPCLIKLSKQLFLCLDAVIRNKLQYFLLAFRFHRRVTSFFQ